MLSATNDTKRLSRNEVIDRLKEQEGKVRSLGVASLFLYGSVARDEAKSGSDIDIFVDPDRSAKFGFLELTGLVLLMEHAFDCHFDVSTRSGLHPRLSKAIIDSAVRVL